MDEPRWDLSPSEAVALQKSLRAQVVLEGPPGEIRTVAGVDVGFEAGGRVTRAAVVVLDFPALTVRHHAIARRPTSFPYIPGLLSFRESPAVLDAIAQLAERPDLLLCDGFGFAHPRRFGIACHVGLLTGIPSIGVGKSPFIGKHVPVPDERGAGVPLVDRGEVIGTVLRTRVGTKPIYVSPGHLVSLEAAPEWVMACTTRFRLPETTRWAHRYASGPLGDA